MFDNECVCDAPYIEDKSTIGEIFEILENRFYNRVECPYCYWIVINPATQKMPKPANK